MRKYSYWDIIIDVSWSKRSFSSKGDNDRLMVYLLPAVLVVISANGLLMTFDVCEAVFEPRGGSTNL
jgi:hypothetical protein